MMHRFHALVSVVILAGVLFAQAQTPAAQPAVTLASVVDREISGVEKQVVEAAEAMPDKKFNFTPESLTIPGGNTRASGRLQCR